MIMFRIYVKKLTENCKHQPYQPLNQFLLDAQFHYCLLTGILQSHQNNKKHKYLYER